MIVDNEDENGFLTSEITTLDGGAHTHEYLMGMQENSDGNGFEWTNTDTSFTFTDWATTPTQEPNDVRNNIIIYVWFL